MMINHYKKGISAIEILFVLAILSIILAIVIPQFSKNRENQVLKTAVGDIASSLDKARSQTLASLNANACSTCGNYGVHFQADKVIIFRGTTFSAGDVNNETISIVSPANISDVTLAGVSGVSGDLYFNRLSGTPNKTGTVTVSTTSYSKTITISATGSTSSN